MFIGSKVDDVVLNVGDVISYNLGIGVLNCLKEVVIWGKVNLLILGCILRCEVRIDGYMSW